MKKLIEYAYPSSTTAKKHGFNNTGCWFVSLYIGDSLINGKKFKFFEDKKDAFNYAESLPNHYHTAHKYFSL